MKSKIFVQRNWQSGFIDPIAVSGGYSDEATANLKVEIAKEVSWVIATEAYGSYAEARIAKIDNLLLAHNNDISSFDSYAAIRRMFLEWVIS